MLWKKTWPKLKLLSKSGTFASVKIAVEKSSGKEFAIKIIDKKKYAKQSGSRKDALMDEVKILQSISHPNIIQIHDVFDTEKTLYIILELYRFNFSILTFSWKIFENLE